MFKVEKTHLINIRYRFRIQQSLLWLCHKISFVTTTKIYSNWKL